MVAISKIAIVGVGKIGQRTVSCLTILEMVIKRVKSNSEGHDNRRSVSPVNIALWLVNVCIKIVLFICGTLAYFTNVHPRIEDMCGPPIAWTLVGVITTLLIAALIFSIAGLLWNRSHINRT